MSDNCFTRHPRESGETYLQHLWFTIKIFIYLVITALAALLHGLLPFLCTHTGSTRIKKLNDTLQGRLHLRDEISRKAS